MGYIKNDKIKLLGEDKMIQYYWQWLQSRLQKEEPWEIHQTNVHTNPVHAQIPMLYPPENPALVHRTNRTNQLGAAGTDPGKGRDRMETKRN